MKRPVITGFSQPGQLRAHMQHAGLRHGDTVRANLTTVNVVGMPNADRRVELRFCPMDSMMVTAVIEQGDGKDLPTEVTVGGLRFRSPGVYDLENAIISSNGTLQLRGDGATRIIRRDRTPRPTNYIYPVHA